MHDFKLFKKAHLYVKSSTQIIADSGYQGIGKIHKESQTPRKKKKKKPLSAEDKRYNRNLSRKRIFVENIIGWLKRFRIISERYRNRRKRFTLRFNIIASIYNMELKMS